MQPSRLSGKDTSTLLERPYLEIPTSSGMYLKGKCSNGYDTGTHSETANNYFIDSFRFI